MGLFGNKYKKNCRRRCSGFFNGMPEVEEACRRLCNSGTTEFTKEEFLCSGKYYEDGLIIRKYGFDPCPQIGTTVDEVFDPLDDRGREDREVQKYSDVLLVGAIVLVIGLAMLVRVIRK